MERAAKRFGGKIDATVDELYQFSSELFSVPFAAVRAETTFTERSGFYYKFWEAPGALTLTTRSLLHALPKFLGDSLVLKEALKKGRELADIQAGRVRYDFARRLDQSRHDFERAMLSRIDATLAGISAAVEKGAAVGAASSTQARERREELTTTLDRIDRLTAELRPFTGTDGRQLQ